ncbi:hypothetical protein [Metapseudomonas resinovorans]|uniref:DUF3077 domain-containing protein n=1 Tax=Metapseudomonas resinovorans NBRC 106553 TaxID=1245471 RepID=S6BFH8_METRE|nr:hypothetical protein [Pseudomonas resinovorans]BAN47819.1 hypothetical protein PCA10_20870 [Pseudomonas resinovorans NBRC 106553]
MDDSRFIPLSENAIQAPVLLLDAGAAYHDLQDCAEQRLHAAKSLLLSFTCMRIDIAESRDLVSVANAAHLLLADASDLLAAARKAALRQSR